LVAPALAGVRHPGTGEDTTNEPVPALAAIKMQASTRLAMPNSSYFGR
jgi:hypothetical protein